MRGRLGRRPLRADFVEKLICASEQEGLIKIKARHATMIHELVRLNSFLANLSRADIQPIVSTPARPRPRTPCPNLLGAVALTRAAHQVRELVLVDTQRLPTGC